MIDTSAREVILARIRQANTEAGVGRQSLDALGETPPAPAYDSRETLLDRFVEVTADYRAAVVRCAPDELPRAIRDGLASRSAGTVVVSPGFDRDLLRDFDGEIIEDSPELTPLALDEIDAVVTGARLGIADTGTIVLDHTGDQGRRAISLVPDLHVCIVREQDVLGSVPEAVAALRDSVAARRPLTWISGPSATSDIELNRVEGVHGPRHLFVIVVG